MTRTWARQNTAGPPRSTHLVLPLRIVDTVSAPNPRIGQDDAPPGKIKSRYLGLYTSIFETDLLRQQHLVLINGSMEFGIEKDIAGEFVCREIDNGFMETRLCTMFRQHTTPDPVPAPSPSSHLQGGLVVLPEKIFFHASRTVPLI